MILEQIYEKGGYFYICGGLKMGKDVQALLKDIIGEAGYKKLDSEKRLLIELWA